MSHSASASSANAPHSIDAQRAAARRAISLSVILPAYNEARRIRASVEEVLRFLEPRFDRFEVIVVDDGSSDATAAEAESLARAELRVLRNERNRGKGFSVRRGMLEAQHEVLLFSDADLSTPIDELERLLDAILAGHDLAIASRWCRPRQDVKRDVLRSVQGRAFACLVRWTTLRGFHDTQCGFKMLRREAARAIFAVQRIDRWGFDVEILHIARKWGLRVAEVPVRWYQSEESKLGLSTPLSMAWDLVKVKWQDLRGCYRRGG